MTPLSTLFAGQRCAVGTWILQSRQVSTIRMAAAAGIDYVFVDMQHSSLDWETVADLCEMARATGIPALVRPNGLDVVLVGKALDVGASGIVAADVRDRPTIDNLHAWSRYPPVGVRGFTSEGPSNDYRPAEQRDQAVSLVVQVEHADSVDRLDELLDGGMIDLVEIGRGDLSASLGVPGQTRHPLVLAAVDHAIAACNRRNVPVGLFSRSVDDALDLVERGARCLTFSSDKHLYLDGLRTGVDRIRQSAGPTAEAPSMSAEDTDDSPPR